MPVDPEIRVLLERLDAQGSLELVRETVAESREHYRLLALARRSSPGTIVPMRAVETTELSDPGGPVGLRSFVPVNDQGNCVITYLHGGGWVLGDLDTHDAICRRVAEETGAVVVAVDYRLAPEHPHPGPLDSVMLALRWSSSQYPGRRHVVMGDSAGASLAAAAAIRARDEGGPSLSAQVLLYPATDPSMSMPSMSQNGSGYFLTKDDMAWFYGHYLPSPAHRADPLADLIHHPVLAGLPPAIVATAEFDPLRDEGIAYAGRLRSAGTPVKHLPGTGMVHGYFGFLGLPAADRESNAVLASLVGLLGADS